MDPHQSPTEPQLLISRTALLHNAALLRHAVRPAVKLCAMVKADAYGHGAAMVVDALANFEADGIAAPAVDALATATIDEAAALPVTSLPILILQPVENALIGGNRSLLELAIRQGWQLTLCSKSAADDVARVAVACGRRASVQVMIDTGMARSGVGSPRAQALLDKVAAWPSLKLAGVCTHFASAEVVGDPFTAEQLAMFRQLVAPLTGKVMLHAANSAAAMLMPESHLDMVRPGIALYGIDPTCRPSMDRKLKPVMKWTAPLVGIRDIPRGTGVGYGHTWRADRDSRIGLVPVGYADGYQRCFSNRGVMLVQEKPAPVVGRVSMDLTTIDLTDLTSASIGDVVTVLDSDPLSPASVYALAQWANTIPYEIFVRIGARVKRVGVDPAEREKTFSAGFP
jgi:alanine racemase